MNLISTKEVGCLMPAEYLRVPALLRRDDYFRLKAIGEDQEREISQQVTYAVRQWLASQAEGSANNQPEPATA